MSDGFLSQEEIDSLLNGGGKPFESKEEVLLTDIEKDLLGEIGNISMGSAATALSTIVNQQVNITTPVVTVTSLKDLKHKFVVPNIAVDVKYTSGIAGRNLLVMKITDAGIIANLMMGGDGKVQTETLSEIEVSAVSEAMNQMIGSAATAMATMFAREVNIAPPDCKVWDEKTEKMIENFDDDENIIQVSFKLTVGDLIDSSIMQILPINTAKKIVGIMSGETVQEESKPSTVTSKPEPQTYQEPVRQNVQQQYQQQPQYQPQVQEIQNPRVDVHQATFQPLHEMPSQSSPRNIDLILDVPLEISVVLGRTKKSIKDILNFGTGSLIELDKLAEEPVEILVNGKKVAYGEVVVVDENFGVRITSIVSSSERLKSLGQ